MNIQSLLVIFVIFAYKTDAGVYECNTVVDCIDPKAECKDSICECPRGTEYNRDGTKCMKLTSVFGGPCEEDVQCSTLTGLAKCKDGACVCGEEYIYLKGKCHRKKAFGDACTKDEECFLGGFYNANKCEENACTCASGFYIRDNTDCMPEGKAIDDLCLIDGDCKIPNSFCNVGRCEVKKPSAAKILIPNINYSRNIGEYKPPREIMPHITFMRNIKCETNKECEGKQNTYCSALFKECMCLKGYFLKDDRCIPELGMECSGDEDCEIKNSVCTAGKCVCKTEPFLYVMNNGNTECTKPAVAPYFYCMEDASCKTFSSNYECLDGPDQRTCKCKSGYLPNEYNICKMNNPGSGSEGSCSKDDDCSTFSPNSVCSSTKYCVCKENYSFINNVCQANVGAPCASPADCVVPNSSCTDAQKCSCEIGYAPITPTECRQVSEGLGKSCEYQMECSLKVSGSECKDGLCSCTDGFLKINEGCYRIAEKMGDYCVLPQSCTVKLGSNVKCRNSQCQCGVGMKPTEDGSDCENKGVVTKATSLLFVAAVALLFS